jgi:multicomponent Na+:H+ antiporter subunit G
VTAALADGTTIVLITAGLFFQFVAAVGLVRFPDVYCRMHVVGVSDTLGSPLVLLAVAASALLGGDGPLTARGLLAAKMALIVALLYFTSPLVSHLLSRAALEAGHRPQEDPERTP